MMTTYLYARLKPALNILLVALCLAGCQPSIQDATSYSDNSSSSKQNHHGTTDAPQHRIISLTIFSDEVLFDLGPRAQKQTIAISALADDRRYHRRAGRWPKDLPRISSQPEMILALQPTHVIAADFTQPEVKRVLQNAGVQVVLLEPMQSYASTRENIRKVAEVCETSSATLLERFEQKIQSLQKKRAPSLKTALYLGGGWYAAGKNTTLDETIRLAGMANVFKAQGFQALSEEYVLALDPDIWIFDGQLPDRLIHIGCAELIPSPFKSLAHTRAAKTCQIIRVDSALLHTTGPDLVLLAEKLYNTVYSPK